MNGVNNKPAIVIGYGELNSIYNKLSEIEVRDEYVQLDYGHHQLVRMIEALTLFLEDYQIKPQFEVGLNEQE